MSPTDLRFMPKREYIMANKVTLKVSAVITRSSWISLLRWLSCSRLMKSSVSSICSDSCHPSSHASTGQPNQ